MIKESSNALEIILDSVIRELHEDPVDLLSIGDGVGESAYLEHSRCSYLRTLRDVVNVTKTLPLERHQIRILEIGAYLGAVSCSLARLGFDVTALDLPDFINNKRLKTRYSQNGVLTIGANLSDNVISVESNYYTLVVMCETLEHLNFNPLPIIAEMNRVLVDGGHLYLSLPNQASLPNRIKLFSGRSIHNPIIDFAMQLNRESNMIAGIHWREYTAVELDELITMVGFSIIRHDFYTTHQASIPARVLYALFPRLRVNQTVVARKTGANYGCFETMR